jgi:hypothetical protein
VKVAAAAATVLACAFAVACSSSGTAPPGDGGTDASTQGDAGPGDGGATKDSAAGSEAGGQDGGVDAPATGDGAPGSTCDAGAGPGDRVLTVTNACAGQTVVVGVNGGYVEDCNAGTCPAGTTCVTTRTPPGCFWDFPAPACGSAVLAAGASATYILAAPPITAPGQTTATKWSGNVYASTQCASGGAGCKTAQCATSNQGKTTVGACPDGTGPQGPTTLAEFTLQPDGADYYDVSAINGVNIPVAMGPLGGAADAANPYTCATAGAVTASPGLAACTWAFDTVVALAAGTTDESTLLRAVVPGGTACTSDASCTGEQVCGTALVFGGNAATRSCGAQVGWWTADELCAYTANAAGAPLDCGAAVAGQGTDAELYGCSGANAGSCYSTTAGATCCGCPDWVIGGQTIAVGSGFTCHGTNPRWKTVALPWAAFVKDACPTAYSFPFDDATSTFTCSTPNPSAASPNGMGYAITLCPGGNDGL